MYLWSFAVAAALGAISALQLRALFYTVLVFVAVCAFAVVRHFLGDHALDILIWAVVYEFCFALGFVAAVVWRYFRATSARARKLNEEKANSAGVFAAKGPKQGNGDPL